MQPGKWGITLFQIHPLELEVTEKYKLILYWMMHGQSGFEIKTMQNERFDDGMVANLFYVRAKKTPRRTPAFSHDFVVI